MDLTALGWNEFFEANFNDSQYDGLVAARVTVQHRERYSVSSTVGDLQAEVAGRFRHDATTRDQYPSVGDWVAISPRPEEGTATIHAVLLRKSAFSRQEAGVRTEEQILAANIDYVFLVTGLDRDFNIRRVERYLTLAWDSGASPVIVMNKADVCDDVAAREAQVAASAVGVPVHPVSALQDEGLEALQSYLMPGVTVACLGSSGVGKSTIINSLLGEEHFRVNRVSDQVGKGQHTTTHRELVVLPGGGIIIDTPGMREIQLWGDEEGLSRTFEDVEALIDQCRFADCLHNNEPGCAVQAALADGTLDAGRYRSYQKLQRELRFMAKRRDDRQRRQDERAFQKMIRDRTKEIRRTKG